MFKAHPISFHSKKLQETQDEYRKLLPSSCIKMRFSKWSPDKRRFSLGIVGARKASLYGISLTERVVKSLRNHPVEIVSGGAYGIDSRAHRAAIEYGLPTQSWLVGSDRQLSPFSNRELFRQIVQTPESALIIPEHLFIGPKNPIRRYFWPHRNYWIAAASDLVLIVEAHEKSGTWWTAQACQDLNVPVFAFPGSLQSPASRGTNSMITKHYVNCVSSVEELQECILAAMDSDIYNKSRGEQD